MTGAANAARLLEAYSRAVLSVRAGNAAPPEHPAPPAEECARRAGRMLASAAGRPILLLGMGDGRLPAELARQGGNTTITVLELAPESARAALSGPCDGVFLAGKDTRRLLTDTSPWAHLVLLWRTGFTPPSALPVLNPFLAPDARRAHSNLKALLSGCAALQLPSQAPIPDLALGAMLHPDDSGLEEFFAQTPPWLAAVHVVWDAPDMAAVPAYALAAARNCAVPVHAAARPLDRDFSAQRNTVLAQARARGHDWLFFLDADERLSPDNWALLPRLVALPQAAWAMPRKTLYPDAQHARAGYGLWPDIQLRLLRLTPGLRFERPVHETVRGIEGRAGLLLAGAILHESWLLKDAAAQAERLAVFDQAAGRPLHRLSSEYPHLEAAFFTHLDAASGTPDALALPGLLE